MNARNHNIRSFIQKMNSVAGLVSAIGYLIPGIMYLAKLGPPPPYPWIPIIVIPLSIFFSYAEHLREDRFLGMFSAKKLIIISIILIIGYTLFYGTTTIYINDKFYQIGFGTANFSLTDEGLRIKNGNCPGNDKNSLLMCAGFLPERIPLIWKSWAIICTGLILLLLYTLGPIFWTLAWYKLASENENFKPSIEK